MPEDHIDPRADRYVLEGRVVTIGPQGVLPDGAIYIEGGRIRAVQDAGQPAPPGFAGAARVRTGDTIYPGLIELHNHLSYNALPLWDVPEKFAHNGRWRDHADYQRLITKPAQTLGRAPGIIEALIRFVECRCLLGGVTTSQGITLSGVGTRSFYEGIVRNVEATDDPALPEAGTKIGNPASGDAADYLANLQEHTCYLQHLSEGVGPTPRGWFLNLQLDSGDWAVNDAFCGIHSTALEPEDFEAIGQRGGSMVWSPLSNFLLYGQTTNVKAARDAGVLIGIGCDWAPSGSKNLLGELKVAWLTSEEDEEGPIFTAEELVQMATIDSARILKWEAELGSIEPGKRADLIAVNGQEGDDYLRLIEARETTLTLVLIGGIPRVGQPRLMRRFAPGLQAMEEIEVGRSTRYLYLEEEESHELLQGLSLTEATGRLREAMQNLPELAQEVDEMTASGLFDGTADSGEVARRIVFDFEELDAAENPQLAAAALADFVQEPLELEGITVADDPHFLEKLVAARNLPEFVKKGLPPLYGETIPLPDSADFLRRTEEPVHPVIMDTTQALKTFLRTSGELTLEQRKVIVEQALLLLEQNYVHLPLKKAMHAVDPVQRLRLLRHRLDEAVPEEMGPEIEFHNEMSGIFNSLRDLHTSYRLPRPFRGKTAWLPFLVEEYWEHDRRKYLVSKVIGDAGPPSFHPGVELLHWNGLPLDQAVAQNAERQAGSNPAARHARGLNSLTIRPLDGGLPPQEEWVTLRYRDPDDPREVHEWTQEWLLFEPQRGANSIDLAAAELDSTATAVGLDGHTDDVQEAKKYFFAGDVMLQEERSGERPVGDSGDGVATFLPTVFRARIVETERGTYGYIRIFTFNVRDDQGFVDEFVRLTGEMPPGGLIIDVRGNGGGLIHAAERLLQLLTPRTIEPQRTQFINTPLNLQICEAHNPSEVFEGFSLRLWIESIRRSVQTGATYSLGFPITNPELCNDLGQRYYGPVLLITDPLCYSATDMFAAGFQDHEIGPILGVGRNTGAGGANVWSYNLLQRLSAGDEDAPYVPLPAGADMRAAIRRTLRVGPNAGEVVEDLGIEPDVPYRMTRRDLLQGNQDLIEKATEILSTRESYPIFVTFEPGDGGLPRLRVKTRNVTRLDVIVNERPQRSLDVQGNETIVDLQEIIGGSAEGLHRVRLLGYDRDRPVAEHRLQVMGG